MRGWTGFCYSFSYYVPPLLVNDSARVSGQVRSGQVTRGPSMGLFGVRVLARRGVRERCVDGVLVDRGAGRRLRLVYCTVCALAGCSAWLDTRMKLGVFACRAADAGSISHRVLTLTVRVTQTSPIPHIATSYNRVATNTVYTSTYDSETYGHSSFNRLHPDDMTR